MATAINNFMPNYYPESGWGVANRAVAGMSDPIFEMFVKLPHLRRELAMDAQRLAMQERQEERLQRQMAAEIPNIEADTALKIKRKATEEAQAAQYLAQAGVDTGNTLAADVAGRLQGFSGLPYDSRRRMLQAPNSSVISDLRSAGVMPNTEQEFNADTFDEDIGRMVEAALTAQRQRVALGSPTAAAMMHRPVDTDAGVFDSFGDMLAQPPADGGKPTDPTLKAYRIAQVMKALKGDPDVPGSNLLTEDYVSQPGSTNTVPTWWGLGSRQEVVPPVTSSRPTPLAGELVNRIQQTLGIQPQQGSAPSYKIQPGHVEDGYEYVGGDPAQPSSWRKVQ